MPLPALTLPLLALAAAGQAAPASGIMVVGHPWAPFISPMGEPFRSHAVGDDTLADWFNQADRNHDGFLTPDEMQADADRFFARLDTNRDGQVDPDELADYEWDIAPEIQTNSRQRRARGSPAPAAQPAEAEHDHRNGRWRPGGSEDEPSDGTDGRLQGAARYGLLNIPEPVAAADADFNRAITSEEFRQAALARFQLLDTSRQGRLSLAGLEALRPPEPKPGHHPRPKEDTVDSRVGDPLPPAK